MAVEVGAVTEAQTDRRTDALCNHAVNVVQHCRGVRYNGLLNSLVCTGLLGTTKVFYRADRNICPVPYSFVLVRGFFPLFLLISPFRLIF